MNRWKIGVVIALALGLALTVGAVLYVGADGLWRAVERVGFTGFAIFCLYNLAGFAPLGLAWWAVAPGSRASQWRLFAWGRLVREAAADILPFSQLGGIVVGVRVVAQGGLSEALAIGSQIADLTTEMAAQIFYTLFGLAMLLAIVSHATAARDLVWTTGLAVVAGAALLAVFVALQGRGVDLIGAIAGRWIKDTRERAEAIKATLAGVYADPRRVAAGVVLHAVGWIWSGAGVWLALRLMDVDVALWKVLTLESLIAAVKGVAFLTPGALGFQEGAYALIAPLFGLTGAETVAISLLRRAKDLVIGAPAVLAWQWNELTARRKAEA